MLLGLGLEGKRNLGHRSDRWNDEPPAGGTTAREVSIGWLTMGLAAPALPLKNAGRWAQATVPRAIQNTAAPATSFWRTGNLPSP